MKRQTLPWMLSMFLVASAGSFGCDDGDSPTTKPDGGGTGGAKVDAAAGGGAGGSVQGGAGGAKGGSGGVAAGGAGGVGAGGAGGGGGSPVGGDAGVDVTATGGTDGGSPDMATDMAAPIDMAADMAAPVDTAPPGSMVNVTQCAEILCPDFFAITSACSGLDDVAWVKQTTGGVTNVCATQSGTKRKISGVDNVEAHTTTVQVFKSNGTPCYTVELFTDPTVDNIEHWTFKKPDSTVFATGGHIESAPNHKNYLVCGNVRYNLDDSRACAGTEGDTSGNATAVAGTCSIP
jgi:hypothetical protein